MVGTKHSPYHCQLPTWALVSPCFKCSRLFWSLSTLLFWESTCSNICVIRSPGKTIVDWSSQEIPLEVWTGQELRRRLSELLQVALWKHKGRNALVPNLAHGSAVWVSKWWMNGRHKLDKEAKWDFKESWKHRTKSSDLTQHWNVKVWI